MTLQPSRRGFITGLIAFAGMMRTSSSLTAPATYDVLSFGGGPFNSSLWVVHWGDPGIHQIFPENWRYLARCADIEIDTINT